MDVDSLVTLNGDQLKPQYQIIDGFLFMVDDKVHIQQMAATSRAGYVPMYNLVLEEKNGYADFSGSQTNKEFWTQRKLENENELLKRKAHEKQAKKAEASKAGAGKS